MLEFFRENWFLLMLLICPLMHFLCTGDTVHTAVVSIISITKKHLRHRKRRNISMHNIVK